MDIGSLSDESLPWVLGFNTFAHEIGVPVPLMPTALFAGARVTEGEANAIGLVLVIMAGGLPGKTVWYAAGRAFRTPVLKTVFRIPPSPDTHRGQRDGRVPRWGRGAPGLGG